jgi:hypothetical protein
MATARSSSNNNWRSDQEAEIEATTIPPSNDLESAILNTLASGAYTAIVRGVSDATEWVWSKFTIWTNPGWPLAHKILRFFSTSLNLANRLTI